MTNPCALVFTIEPDHERLYCIGSNVKLFGKGNFRTWDPPREPELTVRRQLRQAGLEFEYIAIFSILGDAQNCIDDACVRYRELIETFFWTRGFTRPQRNQLMDCDFDVSAKDLTHLVKVLPDAVKWRPA